MNKDNPTTPLLVTDERDHDAPNQDIRIKCGTHTVCVVPIDDAPVEDYNRKQSAFATLIVRAVNSYDVLIEAVREIANAGGLYNEPTSGLHVREIARTALARIKSK